MMGRDAVAFFQDAVHNTGCQHLLGKSPCAGRAGPPHALLLHCHCTAAPRVESGQLSGKL